jgi:hypothetical protein
MQPKCSRAAAPQSKTAANNKRVALPMKIIRNHCAGAALATLIIATTSWSQLAPEYRVEIRTHPALLRPGQTAQLEITVHDPASGATVKRFLPTHEQIFHAYFVSEDLKFFSHDHPVLDPQGTLRLNMTFPRPGLYRILNEFHPAEGEEQSVEGSLVVGSTDTVTATRGQQPVEFVQERSSSGMPIKLRTEPKQPVPSTKSLLFFSADPTEDLEKYEDDWGQLLLVSDDLIDLIRAEPFPSAPAGPGKPVQFNIYFPRARTYHGWVQLSSHGKLTTQHFAVEVKPLRSERQ